MAGTECFTKFSILVKKLRITVICGNRTKSKEGPPRAARTEECDKAPVGTFSILPLSLDIHNKK